MFDFSKTLSTFHKDHIALTRDQQGAMAKRRDANLKRIKDGLEELEKPKYVDSISQGGYVMETMVQPPESDEESRYDIDEGIVFEKDDSKTPATTKEWVRAALEKKGTNFKEAPVAKPKCVRVVYSEGYQCDFPVFRRVWDGRAYKFEIAIGAEWVASDPRAMNDWFEKQVANLSPNAEGGYQLRRIVRYLKYFSRVHSARLRAKLPCGLVLTALCIENYVAKDGRDDESLYETLKRIQNRSEYGSVFANGQVISNNKDVDRIKRLRDVAGEAVKALEVLHKGDAGDKEARKAWKTVFRHSFFDAVEKSDSAAGPVSDADRLRRAQSEAAALAAAGAGEKPWRTE